MQVFAVPRTWLVGVVSMLSLWTAPGDLGGAEQPQAGEILASAGIQGGVIVHVGCDDGRLTAALRANDGFLVHGLDANPASVDAARKHIQSLGLYGKVSVAQWDGQRLPYIENFVDLLVVSGQSSVDKDASPRLATARPTAS